MGISRPSRATAHLSPFFAEWADDTAEQDAAPLDVRPVEEPKRSGSARTKRLAAVGLVAAATVSVVLPMSAASADPSAHTWYRLRMCESSNNYSTNTGNAHYGAYQFDVSTWRSVGGSGYPNRASKAEQDKRALILYRRRGWQPWQCAGILGLREDRDAGSGRTSDISVSHKSKPKPSKASPSTGVPRFPGGAHWYRYGETSTNITKVQDQMHRRGYFPVGTGQYGPNTARMVKQLQRLNGLTPNGYLGPNTWRLAWKGRYSAPASSSAAKSTPAHSIPSFPGGSHWYFYGERSSKIKTFQDQMHRRGFFPVGTGEYGWNTWHLVTTLQKQNGLVPNGLIGPNTWRLAWTGKYRAS